MSTRPDVLMSRWKAEALIAKMLNLNAQQAHMGVGVMCMAI